MQISFEQMRADAVAQATSRARREHADMFVYVNEGIWYVRSMDDGAPPHAVLAAIVRFDQLKQED